MKDSFMRRKNRLRLMDGGGLGACTDAGVSLFATGPYPQNTPNTVSLENTVQQNQSPAVAIFRVAELNRTSLQSLESKWKTRGQFPTRE